MMLAIRLINKVFLVLSSSHFLAAFANQVLESSAQPNVDVSSTTQTRSVSTWLAQAISGGDNSFNDFSRGNARILQQNEDSLSLPLMPEWLKKMPSWLEQLQNQIVEQGKNQIIKLGNDTTKNFYDETIVSLEVNVRRGSAGNFCFYEPASNQLYVNGTALTEIYAGYNYTIKVIATLKTQKYLEVYEKSFGIYVNQTEVPQEAILPDYIQSNTRNKPIWNDEVLDQLEAEPFESGKPIPYVVSLSPMGLLTIGWDTQMEVYSGLKNISSTQILIRQRENPKSSTLVIQNAIENRKEDVSIFKTLTVWNETEKREEDLSMIQPILVQLVSEEDGVDVIRNVAWHLQSSDKDFTKIQLAFQNSDSICMKESHLNIGFWKIEFFKSKGGKSIRRGQTLHWNVIRQACPNVQEEASSLDFIFILYCIALCVLFPVSFLIGNPVPLWIHLHSLQLMVYLQLLSDPVMPDNLNLFFEKFLRIIRFNSPSITAGINDAYDANRRPDHEDRAIIDHQNTLLQQLGYGPLFFSNMPILFGFLGLLCLIWALAALKKSRKVPKVCRRQCPKLLRRQSQHELFMGNFTLRFCFTFFLEMTVSCYLSLQTKKMSSAGTVIEWIFSLAYLLATLALVGLLIAKFWHKGPYLPGYYQKQTLWSLMCWGTRPINSNYDYKKQLQQYRKVQVTAQSHILDQKNRRVSYQISPLDHRNKPQHKIKIKGNQCQPVNQIEEETPPQTERDLLDTDDDHGKTGGSAKLTPIDKRKVPILIQLVDQNSCLEQITEEVPNSNEKLIPSVRKQMTSNYEKEQNLFVMRRQFEGGSLEEPIPQIGETIAQTTIVTTRSRLESVPITAGKIQAEDKPVSAALKLPIESFAVSKRVKKLRGALAAKIHVGMEKTVELPSRIETLFLGLKVNHQKNATLVYPLASLARQILLAAVFVSTPGRPCGLHLVMFSTLCMLGYVCTEKQWKEASFNAQHAVNEAVLYLLCVLMFYFCSVDANMQSRLTVGRYFIAVFALCLLGNILLLSINAVKHLKLVLKRRFVRLNRQRIAREVFLKMKLINRILFRIAQDDQSKPVDEHSQKMKSMKDWFDKSWFEPKPSEGMIQSPSKSEKEKKIQMKPVRTAYGGLQGTFILSESHKPLSFDHISSIRDLSCSKHLTPAHVTDWSLFELQREFQCQDNNKIFDQALQNHVKQFLNQRTPQMPVEYLDSVSRFTESRQQAWFNEKDRQAWYLASELSVNCDEDELDIKLEQKELMPYHKKPLKRMQESSREYSEKKLTQQHILNRQMSKQLFQSPKVMTSRITSVPAFQPLSAQQHEYGQGYGYQQKLAPHQNLYSTGLIQSEYSEIKQVTPMHAINFRGSNHGRGSTSKVSQDSIYATAKFHRESTQLRIAEKTISIGNADAQQISRDVSGPLRRLELNDTGLVDQLALIPRRKKEDSHSIEQSDFSMVGDRTNRINPGRQKSFVSCLLQKQDISRFTEESKVMDMMYIPSDQGSEQQVIQEEELRASDGTSSPERYEHVSNSQIPFSQANSEREDQNLRVTNQITQQNPSIHLPHNGLLQAAIPKIKIDSPIKIQLHGLPDATSTSRENPRTDRVLEFFRKKAASIKNSYQDHSHIDPFDLRERKHFGHDTYQSVERQISKRNRGRNMNSEQKKKNPTQVSWINSSRANSQQNIFEPSVILKDDNAKPIRASHKRNPLFKIKNQDNFNENIVKPLHNRRSSVLKRQGSEIVQTQSLPSRSSVILSEDSCIVREREGFSQVLGDRLNTHEVQAFDKMLINFQALTKNPKLRTGGGSFQRKPSKSLQNASYNLTIEQDQKSVQSRDSGTQIEVRGTTTLQEWRPNPFQNAILDTLHQEWPFNGRVSSSAVPADEPNFDFQLGMWPRRVEPSNQDMREKISFLVKLNKQNQEQAVPKAPVIRSQDRLNEQNMMSKTPNNQSSITSVARLQESVNMTTGIQVIQNRQGEARTTITTPTKKLRQRDYWQ